MDDLDLSFLGGPSSERKGGPLTADEVIDRVQRLADSPRPFDGFPLAWQVEAYYLGDLTAIAAAALREPPGCGAR